MSNEETKIDSPPLWIRHYRIEDIRAVQLEEMETSKVQVFEGGEGTGKTSRLEALRAAFTTKNHRPALVREGAKQGTMIIELTDGTMIQRTYTPDGGAPRAKVQRGKYQPTAVQQFLDELFGEHAFDPIVFMNLSATEQTQELMLHMPIELSREKALELGNGNEWESVNYEAHPLELLRELEQAMYNERLSIGREEKMHQETAYGIMEDDLPQGFDAEAARQASSEELSKKLAEGRAHNTEVHNTKENIAVIRQKRKTIQAEIKGLREEGEQKAKTLQTEIEGIEEKIARLHEDIKRKCTEVTNLGIQVQASIEEKQGKIGDLDECEEATNAWLTENEFIDVAPILEQLTQHDKTKEYLGLWRSAQEHQEKAAKLKAIYLHLADLIQAVRSMPGILLSQIDIPIKNLAFNTEAGCFEINGRPLDALSDGEQLRLSLDIARMTTGPLKIITIDQAETLDPERWRQLLEAARNDEFQYFISRVGKGELKIVCFDERPD